MRKKLGLMQTIGVLLISIGIILFILLVFFKIQRLQMWYEEYQSYLINLEMRVAEMRNSTAVLLAIFLLFTLKAVLPMPLIPVSCVCVITSMVFGTFFSVILNILGLVIIFTIRYYIGARKKTLPYRILKNYEEIWNVLEHDGSGNPWLLFLTRVCPLFPVNTVSNIYGSLEYDFRKYLLLSVSGFLPKIISYSIIGHNAFNPFSASFIVPVMISSFLSGMGLLVTRKFILFIRRKGEEDVKVKN